MRVAVFVHKFPSISETFVLDHIVGLLDRGMTVDILAELGDQTYVRHAVIDKYQLQSKVCYAKPAGQLQTSRTRQALRLFGNLGALFLHKPFVAMRLTLSALRQRDTVSALWCGLMLARQQTDYDIVHCHSGHNGNKLLPAFLAGLQPKARWAVTFHGFDFTTYVTNGGRDVYSKLFKRVDRIYVCSEFSRLALKGLEAPIEKLAVIANGLDSQNFRPRQRWQVRSPYRLITVGRFVPFKGHFIGVQVLRRLMEAEGLDVFWDVIGDGALRNDIESRAHASGVAERITWHGALDREAVYEAMRQADVYLHTGIVDTRGAVETQGVALMEAMALGIPVVASSAGGVSETLGYGRAGMLVEAGDVDGFTRAVKTLLSSSKHYEAYANAGPTYVSEHFDLAKLQDLMAQDYLHRFNDEAAHGLVK